MAKQCWSQTVLESGSWGHSVLQTPALVPESWRLATVIPIPKPGKDHAEPTNYRPIALTSCLCKTRENDKQMTCLVLRI